MLPLAPWFCLSVPGAILVLVILAVRFVLVLLLIHFMDAVLRAFARRLFVRQPRRPRMLVVFVSKAPARAIAIAIA
jgi:hypothetical protein